MSENRGEKTLNARKGSLKKGSKKGITLQVRQLINKKRVNPEKEGEMSLTGQKLVEPISDTSESFFKSSS